MWNLIADRISEVTNQPFEIQSHRSVAGGCINQGYQVQGSGDRTSTTLSDRTYFVKLNRAVDIEMFEAEALGLQQMYDTQTIRVPAPICTGVAGNSAYIVLEWLEFGGGKSQSWAEMGRQLARLHSAKPPRPEFGWDGNNTIGSTPQINTWTADWVDFYREHRLGYQFRLAKRRGGNFPQEKELLEALPELLRDHHPQPSLVHGDLWSGNAACLVSGEPVIFDPATYVGDREVDLAMTELFGGFPASFYQGYHQILPPNPGYSIRKTLYNLYHILNHFNLFGGGYGSQANSMIRQLLR
ncbi:fructosamine kinase family protein [Roseofilum capinflatum]|uniref:Fructosamine kinase family protein n=1 Tax=Roseofilum capinflatum BLCC-M114 TaxID=3022440 RepID=A0ABT7B4G6_9CYAN|nr:fructosamine kinase family protein [Roseofilum capinflatum BLCC-M114]